MQLYTLTLYYLVGSFVNDEARKILVELTQPSVRRNVAPSRIAIAYAHLGEIERAFDWLETAYEERDSQLIFLRTTVLPENIRSDPRFKDLMRRVGLPE